MVSRYQFFRPHTREEVIDFIEKHTADFNIEGNWHQIGVKKESEWIGDIGAFILSALPICSVRSVTRLILFIIKMDLRPRQSDALQNFFSALGSNGLLPFWILSKFSIDRTAGSCWITTGSSVSEKHMARDGQWEDDMIYAMLKEAWGGEEQDR